MLATSVAAYLQAKGRSLAAVQLPDCSPWDGTALEQWRITELLNKNILDLSSARILILLGTQRVPPQQSVLWLEHRSAPSAIWESLPAGLVVLRAQWPEVRKPQ